MKEIKFKKCQNCDMVVEVMHEGSTACNEANYLVPNTVEASFEKHMPQYEVDGNKMTVRVNHVMEENHYIEWIMIVKENKTETTYFKPGDTPVVETDYVKGAKIYAFCNLHSLWMNEVK